MVQMHGGIAASDYEVFVWVNSSYESLRLSFQGEFVWEEEFWTSLYNYDWIMHVLKNIAAYFKSLSDGVPQLVLDNLPHLAPPLQFALQRQNLRPQGFCLGGR